MIKISTRDYRVLVFLRQEVVPAPALDASPE